MIIQKNFKGFSMKKLRLLCVWSCFYYGILIIFYDKKTKMVSQENYFF